MLTQKGGLSMNRMRLFAIVTVILLSYAFVPFVRAQVGEVSDVEPSGNQASQKASTAQAQATSDEVSSGVRIGLQVSTNFQEMLAGLKIQMDNFAITPKFGFFVQSIKDHEGSVFNVGLGSGFDYYFGEAKLRPYVGGDFLMYIPHVPGDTDIWFVLSPHLGAEYWLSNSFSVGGNIGVQFGVGDSFYTQNTLGFVVGHQSDFSFGINGMINLTYYF
jgi:hypothetical protein